MATFLIRFLTRRAKKPLGSALIHIDLPADEISVRVKDGGGDTLCECCRGRAVFEEVRDATYDLGIAPKGNIEASVFDVSHDHRITREHMNRLLTDDAPLIRQVAQRITASGTLH